MAETLHHQRYMIEGSNGFLHQAWRGLGHIAQMGIGVTRVGIEGISELCDPEIGILRSHRPEQPTMIQPVNLGTFTGTN